MPSWHIAQFNVGRAVAPLESAELADFVANLDRINALAQEAPGFVWRLQSDDGNATDIKVTDDPQFIINMSVWSSIDALFDFVYRTAHSAIMARRREWFERPAEAYQVLWWVPAGHTPTPEEALERLELLRREGPSAQAFHFKSRFPPPGEAGGPSVGGPEPTCVGWS
jgi:hypothetical protein